MPELKSTLPQVRATHSLGIASSLDLFHALQESIDDYLNDAELSARKALSAAIFAWNLTDWVWREYYDVAEVTRREFQETIKSDCPPLSYLEDIANGTKHLSIVDHTPCPSVKSTTLHEGSFSRAFSRAFDRSRFILTLADDAAVDFDTQLNDTSDYWRSFFTSLLCIQTSPSAAVN